jgi:hypothetical protein
MRDASSFRRRRPDDARRGPEAERTVYVYVFYRSDSTRARAPRAVHRVRWCDDDDASDDGRDDATIAPRVSVDIAF